MTPPFPPSSTGSQHGLDPLQAVHLAVFGLDGANGLRSVAKDHAERLDRLEEMWATFHTTLATLRVTARWGAIALFLTVVTFGSDQTIAWIASRLKLVRDVGLF